MNNFINDSDILKDIDISNLVIFSSTVGRFLAKYNNYLEEKEREQFFNQLLARPNFGTLTTFLNDYHAELRHQARYFDNLVICDKDNILIASNHLIKADSKIVTTYYLD